MTPEINQSLQNQEMITFIARELASMRVPEFADSPVPMEVAQKVLHMDADQIRNRMECGLLDIGFIFPSPKKRGKRTYRNTYISPKKFWEVTGYVWKGGEVSG